MFGKYRMLCCLCSVIIDKYKTAVKFDIHLVSCMPVWNGIPAFVPPYMGAAAGFMPIRPSTGFTGNKRQGSQAWFFFRFKDAPAASGALLERLVIEFFYCFSDSGI
jgi:hypothetical protein